MSYDSTVDTIKHIQQVQYLLQLVIEELLTRSRKHDKTKLESPEKEVFDEFTPKLKDSTYMSEEYKQFLEGMGVALKHHYAKNKHHPEHRETGIDGMSLIDLLEMICDWKAAADRHTNGDISESIKKNIERFKISPQLASILGNTAFFFSTHG
jgi:hypothetical protein